MKTVRTDRTQLQIIAMITMFIDHLGCSVFPIILENAGYNYHGSVLEFLIRGVIGRIAFPLFVFLLVEGIYHSHNLYYYILRLLILGLISFIPHMLFNCGKLCDSGEDVTVLFTLILAALNIFMYEKLGNIFLRIGSFIILCVISFVIGSEYAITGIVIAFVFYIFRYKTDKLLLYGGIALIAGSVMITPLYYLRHYGLDYCVNNGIFSLNFLITGAENELASLIALIFIYLYDEKKKGGKGLPKIFTYGFYPLHLTFLYIISLIIK